MATDILPALRSPAAHALSARAALRSATALAICVVAGVVAHRSFVAVQLEEQHRAAGHRLEFFANSLEALLERNEALPRLLTLDARLAALLDADTPATRDAANRRLEAAAAIAQVDVTYLMNHEGLTLAASNWNQRLGFVGRNYAFRPYFEDAAAGRVGRFYGVGVTTGEPGYFLAAALRSPGGMRGVVAAKVSLRDFEAAMTSSGENVVLVDHDGVVFLSAVPAWKYHVLEPLSASARERIDRTQQYGDLTLPQLNLGERYAVSTRRVGALGWRMLLLSDVREPRRNALLAGVAAALAAALALGLSLHLELRRRRGAERLAAEAQLHAVHATLEQRIVLRTAELEQKVTALKHTEAILRETRDSAVQAGKLAVLGQMSAGMNHELNQPLAALHTLSDNAILLLAQQRVAEAQENLSLIRQLAARMGRIVMQIKAFARKEVPVLGPVSVAQAIEHALVIVEPRRAELRASIGIEPVAAGLCVHADATRLEQVLVNLLRNGLDAVAAQERREVQVAAACCGTQVQVRIRDFGAGIPPDVLPRLFEPFYSTKPVGQGLGLGLALSLTIVDTFGGRLEARNAEGGGAEFSIWLEPA